MSARKKSKGKIPGMSVAEPPTERERLCLQLQGNLGLLDALLSVADSPNTTVQIEETKERLRGICTQQQDLLQVAEETIDELTRQNEKQRKQIKRLQHKVDSANYELRRALGIRGKSKDATDASAGKENGSGQDATAESTVEKKKAKKRGAPKGHRGASRTIPDHYDHERFIAPVTSCNCGCESVTAMTDFDVRYVEDIPPVAAVIRA